ncbi:MAG: glycosyltransferase [Thiohalocapsa sp.]
MPGPIRVHGKSFFAGAEKHVVKGVTYGPFAVGSHGAQFAEHDTVEHDFALMREAGANTLRVFTVPPLWLLDMADAAGLKVLVGLPWTQHVTFLDSPAVAGQIRTAIADGVRACLRHPAVFAYLVGNEIPPDMVRWHGASAVERFLRELVGLVRQEHPGALVSYANFPSTEYLAEYLALDCLDFLCFNVYLHEETAFRRYIGRLHNLAPDKPLVLTEFGIDSMRHGAAEQAQILSWQICAAFAAGVAGTFVFAWTDEWFTGGHPIENWAFGLVDRRRRPKPAYDAVAGHYRGALPPPLPRTPPVSVVVCAYNAERTMEACLASLETLNYPDYEVIVVNDGSTDGTLAISERFPYCRIISQPNKGLSVARNVGAEAATGEIVAYTDSDCVADPDWLTYLVGHMEEQRLTACGGPNFPPPEDALVPAAVAVSPGGPTHVLLTDDTAEHIAGCNMAFRRDRLLALGGFDPQFRAAGDDVDICWRFQDAGDTIGFSPAAVVWHFRRNTVEAYLNQQKGYGKAEALVYAKHPARFNLFGQARWAGRIYGDLSSALLLSRRPLIYSGAFGRGPYQMLYEPPASLTAALPMTFEWGVAAILLVLIGAAIGGWLWLLATPLLLTWALCINGALKASIDPRFSGPKARALVALLIYLGPLLRGWARLKWRIKTAQAAETATPAMPLDQRPRVDWPQRGFTLSYWNERSLEKEVLIGGLADLLAARHYPVIIDTGWSGVDLDVAHGLFSRALVTACGENHGGDKRLLRVRAAMRVSNLGRALLAGLAVLVLGSLAMGSPVAARVFFAVALVGLGVIGRQLIAFARLMQRMIAATARQADLLPSERSDGALGR